MNGVIRIGQKEFKATVVDGIRYVDGLPVNEFLETLTFDERLQLALLGQKVANGLKSDSPQATLDAIVSTKNKN